MYSAQGAQAYRQTDVSSMTREKVIVLVYERIVSDLHEALVAIGEGDRIAMSRATNHSQRIISELRSALDHSIGGDISRNLEALYDFMFRQHLEMVVDMDPQHARDCLRVIQPLLAAWRKVPVSTGAEATWNHVRGSLPAHPGPDHVTTDQSAPAAHNADGVGNPNPTPAEEAEPGQGAVSELFSHSD